MKNKRAEFRNPSQYVARYGMLIALAFILSFVESLIPMPFGVPGVKLGLANLVTVAGLYTVGAKGTAAVSLLRIVLVGFTFGNMSSMIYSLAGGALSLGLMILCRRGEWFGTVGVSIVGGIGHNIGQVCVAALVLRQAAVFYYLSALLFSGTLAGLVIGILGGLVVERAAGAARKL